MQHAEHALAQHDAATAAQTWRLAVFCTGQAAWPVCCSAHKPCCSHCSWDVHDMIRALFHQGSCSISTFASPFSPMALTCTQDGRSHGASAASGLFPPDRGVQAALDHFCLCHLIYSCCAKAQWMRTITYKMRLTARTSTQRCTKLKPQYVNAFALTFTTAL